MPPQFQALRALVKQSRWVGAVLVPFKTVPYPVERKSDPGIDSTILGTHNSIRGGKLYVIVENRLDETNQFSPE